MKNVLLATIASSFFMFSCTEDLENTILPSKSGKLQTRSLIEEGFQVIDYNGEGCIRFDNDSIFKEIVSEITYASSSEKRSMFSKLGFISQMDIMEEAEKEQEAIVDNYEKDLNQAFPHQQIENFKQKYADVFLFNPYDSTDFIPNYKTSMYRYFINRQGIFFIGDSLINVPQYTPEEVFGSPVMALGSNEHTDDTSINKAETKYQIPGGDYVKVRIIPEFVGYTLDYLNRQLGVFGAELLSQKKKVLWKKHHADVFLSYDLQCFQYNINQQIVSTSFKKDELKIHVYGKVSAEDNPMFSVAADSKGNYGLGGPLEIWSNEIPIKGYTTVRCSGR